MCFIVKHSMSAANYISLGGLATLSNIWKATDCCCTMLAWITLRPPCFCWPTA